MDDQNKAEVVRLARKGWTAEHIATQLHKESADGLTFNQPSVEAVEAELERVVEAQLRIDELNKLCMLAMKVDSKEVRQTIATLVLERIQTIEESA